MKKTKQISYLSAVIILIGSTIGAGIFFKNDTIFENAGGSIWFLIASWLVAGFGILAIGLSLLEVSSATKNNSGMLGWLRKFAGKKASKYGTAYMLLIYMPMNYLAMPLYAVMSMQDAGVNLNEWMIAGMAFGIFIWTAITTFFSMKFGEISQWIYTFIKFIPLIVIMLFSLIQVGQEGVSDHIKNSSASGLTGLSPWLGIMASIPAILFAIDGFYTVTALKTDLKDEKKLGSIMTVGIAIVIGIYLLFAIISALPGVGFGSLNIVVNNPWIYKAINIAIMFAVIGIINGFALSATSFYASTEKNEKIGLISTTKKWFKIKKDRNAAFVVIIILTLVLYIVLIPLGIYGIDSSYHDEHGVAYYVHKGQEIGSLYTMADMLTNYTSLLVFFIIGAAILGAIVNRRTNKIKVKKLRFFLSIAWTAVIFISIGGIYMFIETIVNMTGFNGADSTTSITNFVIMAIMIFVSAIPLFLDKIKNSKAS